MVKIPTKMGPDADGSTRVAWAPARLGPYLLVGGGVALLYVGLYAGLRRTGLSELSANLLAFGTAVVVQYAGQTLFTFRRRLGDGAQIARFVVMIGAGLALSAVVTAGLAPALGWPDAAAAAVAAVATPVQNFILMRLWVYSGAPGDREAAP